MRAALADLLMRLACGLIEVAEWLDPAPMPPGCDERMRTRLVEAADQHRSRRRDADRPVDDATGDAADHQVRETSEHESEAP